MSPQLNYFLREHGAEKYVKLRDLCDSVVKSPFFPREKPLYLLILIIVLYFYRPIFLGEVFYYRDLFSHFVPKRKLVAEYVSRLELPLWDPYLQGGKPLLANPNNMALYPSNLLYTFVPAPSALTIEIISHLLAGSLAMYAFCRLLQLQQSSSLIAAAIYGFCGYALSTTNLLNWLMASTCLPVLFCFWHLYLTKKGKKWWLLSLLAASLQLLAGAPELTLITFVTLLAWTLFYSYPDTIRSRIFSWVSLSIFTAGVCMIQILPAIEFSRSSIRSVGFGFESSTVWSLHPYRIPELVFPGILGRFDSISPGSYWGQELEGKTPFFLSIYFGISAIVLALVGGFTSNEQKAARISLVVTVLFSIILAMGRHLPGLSGLFALFSLRVPFRFPEKWLAASVLPISVLAAFGSEFLFSDSTGPKKFRTVFWILNGALLTLVVTSFALPKFIEVVSDAFNRPVSPEMTGTFQKAFLHAFLIWTLICILYEAKFKWKGEALAVILFLDLLSAGVPLKIFCANELYVKTPPLAMTVKNEIHDGKLFRSENAPHYVLYAPDDSLYWRYAWQQEVLDAYLASNYEVPVIFQDDLDASSLIELNYLRLMMGPLPWEKKLPLLSAAGVNLILTPETIGLKDLRPLAKIRNASSMELYLYSNDSAVKSLRFVTRSHFSKNAPESFQYMTSSGFDPDSEVILNTSAIHKNDSCDGSFQILESHRSLQSRNYLVKNQCDGFFVFGEPNYSGWQLSIDNKKTELLKADSIYSAAFVQKGRHTIEKVYSPDSVTRGIVFSGLFVIFALVFAKKIA
jgi:hypothetical protein